MARVDLRGHSFKTKSGLVFTVVKGTHFPATKIKPAAYKEYLTDLRPDRLVSMSYFNTPVPLITVEDGVVRLDEVRTMGQLLKGSGVISPILGVAKTQRTIRLERC